MTGLKRIRQSRGMSMEELGKAVGVSRQVVSAWELGIYWPKASSLPRIAEVLRCTIDELFRDTSQSAAPTAPPLSLSAAPTSLPAGESLPLSGEPSTKEELPWN